MFLHVDSEVSDQTGRIPRLIRVFTGRTVIFLFFYEAVQIIIQSYFIVYNVIIRCSIPKGLVDQLISYLLSLQFSLPLNTIKLNGFVCSVGVIYGKQNFSRWDLGRIWDLIVSVPDHCLSFYFKYIHTVKVKCSKFSIKIKKLMTRISSL